MKKILFLLSAAIILLASCEGPAGKDAEVYWFVKTYTINSNQWELINGEDQINSFFRAEIVIPELDRDIYKDGNVFCYMFQNVDGVEVQTPLPYSIPVGQSYPNGSEELWTETYAFDFTVGSIMFYVNYSDFYTNNRPPTTRFRVVMNY